jgi:hypothetical protein
MLLYDARCCLFKEGIVMSKLSIAREFWEFLKVRKKWWLAPIIIFLFLLGALIIFTEGSAVAPFIYTLF